MGDNLSMLNLNYIIAAVITMVVSYLLGSISFSIIITKKSKLKADIRTMGSGNAGFTNVLRSVGKVQAILTMLGDFLKCVLAILFSRFVFTSKLLFETQNYETIQYAAYLAGLCFFLGHIYPCFFNFKGGKGVLTAAAIVLMTDWRIFFIAIGVFLICLIVSKIVSLSSIISVSVYPISTFVIGYFWDYNFNKVSLEYVLIVTALSVIISFFIIYSHRSNIKRLKNGTEKKISVKKN